MVDIQPTADMSYQETLVIAMKKEKKAFLLYTHLADMAMDTAAKKLFLMLAQEEAKHKLRFEIEYDNTILSDN
jgi:rubrerythrin